MKQVLDLATVGYVDAADLRRLSSLPQDARRRELSGLCQQLFTDTSQNPARKAYTCKKTDCMKCLTTSSCLYSHGRDRVVLALEHLLFQGHSLDVVIPRDMRQSSLKSLAGEGIALPCLATLVYALHHTNSLCV